MTIVIQIAFCKTLAEPLVALNIVRSQISLFAGIQSFKVRSHMRCILCLTLVCSYQIISSGLILTGGWRRSQWIRRSRLRIADDIVPLNRVLIRRSGLIRTDQIIPGGFILTGGRRRSQWICRRRLRITCDIVPLGRVLGSGRVLRIRHASEKQCGIYQWREAGRFQDALLSGNPRDVIACCAKTGCSDANAIRALRASYAKSTLTSVRQRTWRLVSVRALNRGRITVAADLAFHDSYLKETSVHGTHLCSSQTLPVVNRVACLARSGMPVGQKFAAPALQISSLTAQLTAFQAKHILIFSFGSVV
jgi:hypothetical protein